MRTNLEGWEEDGAGCIKTHYESSCVARSDREEKELQCDGVTAGRATEHHYSALDLCVTWREA